MKDERRWQTVRISAELAEALEQFILTSPRPRPTRGELLEQAWEAYRKRSTREGLQAEMAQSRAVGESRAELRRILRDFTAVVERLSDETRKPVRKSRAS